MPFPAYRSNMTFGCALVVGSTRGMSRALATYFVKRGKKVLVAGFVGPNVKETWTESAAAEIGATGAYSIANNDDETLRSLVTRVTTEHPDLDCLVTCANVNNAFGQELSQPSDDRSRLRGMADHMLHDNMRQPQRLTELLLPHFREHHDSTAVIITVGANLGLMPPLGSLGTLWRSADACTRWWIGRLRSQLARERSNVKMVEIMPSLTTESAMLEDLEEADLHPDVFIENEFLDNVYEELEEGNDIVMAGLLDDGTVSRWEFEQQNGVSYL